MNLVLTFEVKKPIETVFENLTDMQKFVSFHPIIDKIEPVSGNHYFVEETLRFGSISLSFEYFVSINVQFHNVVGGFSPPFERSGGVAGTELEGRA